MSNWPVDLGTLPLYRGDAHGRNKVTITLTDNDDEPVDLTAFGDEWASQARANAASTASIDLDVDDTGAEDGVLVVSVPDEHAAALRGPLVFDVQVTGGSIDPLTLFAGKFSVGADVTR